MSAVPEEVTKMMMSMEDRAVSIAIVMLAKERAKIEEDLKARDEAIAGKQAQISALETALTTERQNSAALAAQIETLAATVRASEISLLETVGRAEKAEALQGAVGMERIERAEVKALIAGVQEAVAAITIPVAQPVLQSPPVSFPSPFVPVTWDHTPVYGPDKQITKVVSTPRK